MTDIFLPPHVSDTLRAGADCAISISGGKDSQALLLSIVPWFRAEGFKGRLFAIFADLGRAEWWQTPSFIQQICRGQSIELVVVRRNQGDLLQRFEERMHTIGTESPFWPSAAARYCSSDNKRSPINSYLRRSHLVFSLEGIRAAESDARAEKTPLTTRTSITGKRYHNLSLDAAWSLFCQDQEARRALPLQQPLFADPGATSEKSKQPRLALTWYPLFSWTVEDVWQSCGASTAELVERRQIYREGVANQDADKRAQALSGWPAHPAYVLGGNRLSCSLCVLGDGATLLAGAQHNPEYYRALCLLEAQSGWSFQPSRWLCDVAPTLLTDEIRLLLARQPRRLLWISTQQQKRRRTLPMSLSV
jgi:3'-phosphoadenosine 5'-phosphosulfate sulfotransferase (PAPS reductase)/FAD synthetase